MVWVIYMVSPRTYDESRINKMTKGLVEQIISVIFFPAQPPTLCTSSSSFPRPIATIRFSTLRARFNITQNTNPHLASGHSKHSCLGSRLMAHELTSVLPALSSRVSQITIYGEIQ